MKARFQAVALLSVALSSGLAQVASHAPTLGKTVADASAPAPTGSTSSMQVTDKAVARVNGAVLTDRDLADRHHDQAKLAKPALLMQLCAEHWELGGGAMGGGLSWRRVMRWEVERGVGDVEAR